MDADGSIIMLLLAAYCLHARLIEALVTQTQISTRSLASAATDLSRSADVGKRGEGEWETTARDLTPDRLSAERSLTVS